MATRMCVGLARFLVLAGACALAIGARPSSADQPAAPVAVRPANPYDYFGGLEFSATVPTPRSVLGHTIGERFTRHGQMVAYLKALALASDRVRLEQYGVTHQGRALHFMAISSPKNLARLPEILRANQELTDPRTLADARLREIAESNPAIVWLSYNVHGNEASCTETAIQVAYTLAGATNKEVLDILDKLVVVIEPMLNPDGHERYVGWYQNVMPASGPQAQQDAAEHDEPWPGGRSNHYLFDLNRDWLWLVHPESRARLAAYRRFMPQLHIDYHEQEPRSPYFFGAGEDPYNTNIPAETREWLDRYGAANAAVFDREGRVYSTRERFDYLYPGYGKVLPVYHGAVGMLTEKGGHGRAGLAIALSEQHTLTLQERVRDHFLTSMSYVETTAGLRREQIERFARFFKEGMRVPDGRPRAFVVWPDNDAATMEKVWRLSQAHGFEIETLGSAQMVEGLKAYKDGAALGRVELPAGAWVIRADQPRGRLVTAIFERATEVTTPETYDITGWSIPIVFGLRAAWTDTAITARTEPLREWRAPTPAVTGEGAYALVIDARQSGLPRAIGAMGRLRLDGRLAGEPFEMGGRTHRMGSLVVHGGPNGGRDLGEAARAFTEMGVSVERVSGGMTTGGHVLGANNNRHIDPPRIAIVRNEPTNSLSFGELWHLMDIEQPVPYTPINARSLRRADLSKYNVIVLPDASESGLTEALGERTLTDLRAWVRGGGVLVTVGASARWAAKNVLELKDEKAATPGDGKAEKKDAEPRANELTWRERRDRVVDDDIPGAMLRATVDTTHPLSAGVADWIGVIKESAEPLPVGEDGYVVARFDKEPYIGGRISKKRLEKLGGTPYMTHHRLGSGGVIAFSDAPALRGFTCANMRLFMNAVTVGPSL